MIKYLCKEEELSALNHPHLFVVYVCSPNPCHQQTHRPKQPAKLSLDISCHVRIKDWANRQIKDTSFCINIATFILLSFPEKKNILEFQILGVFESMYVYIFSNTLDLFHIEGFAYLKNIIS